MASLLNFYDLRCPLYEHLTGPDLLNLHLASPKDSPELKPLAALIANYNYSVSMVWPTLTITPQAMQSRDERKLLAGLSEIVPKMSFSDLSVLKSYIETNGSMAVSFSKRPRLEFTGSQMSESEILDLAQLIKVPKLDSVSLSDSTVSPETLTQFCKAVAQSQVSHLALQFTFAHTDCLVAIADALESGSSALKQLDLVRSHVGNDGIIALARVIGAKSGSTLTSLKLLGTGGIWKIGMTALAEALRSPHCHLQYLEIMIWDDSITQGTSPNMILPSPISPITRALVSANANLKVLKLADCILTRLEAKEIADAIQSNPNLKLDELDLSHNLLANDGIEILAKSPLLSRIARLHLGHNGIGAEGAVALSQLISDPASRLKHLDLQENEIGDAGAEAIGKALEQSRSQLTLLNLKFNRIGSNGAYYIARALATGHCKILDLDLQSNRLGPDGGKNIVKAIAIGHSKLKKLNLRRNQLRDNGVQAIARYIGRTQVEDLDLGRNQLTTRGLATLADALIGTNSDDDGKSSLRHLDFTESQFGEDGAAILAKLFGKVPRLASITIQDCQIGRKGCQLLLKALSPRNNIFLHQSIQIQCRIYQ